MQACSVRQAGFAATKQTALAAQQQVASSHRAHLQGQSVRPACCTIRNSHGTLQHGLVETPARLQGTTTDHSSQLPEYDVVEISMHTHWRCASPNCTSVALQGAPPYCTPVAMLGVKQGGVEQGGHAGCSLKGAQRGSKGRRLRRRLVSRGAQRENKTTAAQRLRNGCTKEEFNSKCFRVRSGQGATQY